MLSYMGYVGKVLLCMIYLSVALICGVSAPQLKDQARPNVGASSRGGD